MERDQVGGQSRGEPPHVDDALGATALQAENAALRSEAAQSASHVELLLAFSHATTQTLEVEPLIEKVMALAIAALDVDSSVLHLVRDGCLSLAGLRNKSGDLPANGREVLRELAIDGETISGRAAKERRTVVVNRQSWPERSIAMVQHLTGCFGAATPLLVGERLIGTICVARRTDRPMTPRELQLLEACAAHMGAAIEHARLLDEERRRVQDLSLINELAEVIAERLDLSAVLATGTRYLARISGIANTFLFLIEGGNTLRIAASTLDDLSPGELVIPLDEPSMAAEAIRRRAPVAVVNIDTDARASKGIAARFGHQAVLAIPLLSRGDPIGVVVLGDARARRQFTAAEVDRAVAICNQLASAIVNARLYEAECRRVEELHLVLEIGRVITGSLNLDEILDAGAVSLARMVGASESWIWLLEPSSSLRGVSTSADEHKEHFRGVRLTLDDPALVARAVLARAPVQIVDTSKWLDGNALLYERYKMRSLLALPLMLRDEPIGAVVVGEKSRTREWTEPEIERATVVVRHLAIAIANARLFEDLKQSYHDLAHTQQALVERERLAALGELAAVVAHEVRNPLGIIWNSLGSLRRILKPSGDVAMLLEIVGEESDRLNRIVGELLDFVRPYSPELRAESIEAVVASAIEAVRSAGAAKQIEFALETTTPLPLVWADARLLRRAFLNLVQNAIQAMPNGGRVTIRACVDRSTSSENGGERARVDVIDDGPGIPAEDAPQVFQPFFTTRATGTGLGLAVVKRIVEAHRGDVCVASRPPSGTTFTVRLPLAPR